MQRNIFNLLSSLVALVLGVTITICFAQSLEKLKDYSSDMIIPSHWKRIELGKFSFYMPRDMKDQKVRGIDSSVWEFRNRNMRLSIDYGMYSNDLKQANQPEYKTEWVSIDGEKAKVATFRSSKSYIAAVYFPGLWGSDTKLTFWVESKSAKEQEMSKKIFQSIKFRK